MNNRRDFIKKVGLGSLFLSSGILSNCLNSSKRPNILWIISEDTSPDFACYGNKIVKTPNVDKLAKEGTLFNNAFATCPVCSPSRSAFNTGMYQTSFGAHQHRTKNKKKLPGEIKVITDYFREAGYYTSNSRGLNFDKQGKTDWNFTLDHDGFDGTDWRDRNPGQPFFAQVNLSLTHRIFKRDKDNPINPDDVTIHPHYPDHPIIRRDHADYLESIQILDKQIGQVLDRLDKDGLTDNTVIFYFGDHGVAKLWAKQWLYEGGIRVPLIIKYPENFSPNSINNDLVSLIDLLPTSLGIAGIKIPDFLHGQSILGKNKRKYIVAARDRCDETVERIRCIRTKDYKYIKNFMPDRPYTQFNAYKTFRYPSLQIFKHLHKKGELSEIQLHFMKDHKPAEELYDLKNDPRETVNLAENPDYSNILKKMHNQLDDWIKTTGDKGKFPESQAELDFWKNRMNKRNKQWMKSKGLPENPTTEEHLLYWENYLNRK